MRTNNSKNTRRLRPLCYGQLMLFFTLLLTTTCCLDTNVTDTSLLPTAQQPEAATMPPSVWTTVLLTPQIGQLALDAVRYRQNYDRSVTTHLCLHRINTIKTRVVSSLRGYLFSVDGCELDEVVSSGRCDIYDCRLYTYELRVTQKSAKDDDVYVVQSIFKTLVQKPLSELMQPSNLDFMDDGIQVDDEAANKSTSTSSSGANTTRTSSNRLFILP